MPWKTQRNTRRVYPLVYAPNDAPVNASNRVDAARGRPIGLLLAQVLGHLLEDSQGVALCKLQQFDGVHFSLLLFNAAG